MATKAEEWEKKVSEAEEHASHVYVREVEHLERQIEATDKHEAHEIEHVEHQVERDVKFAEHHVEYLRKVIDREIKRVDRADAKLEKKVTEGASEKSIERAAAHAVNVEDDAEAHVTKVVEHVLEEIERDAKAAARHIVKGLEKIGLDEEDLSVDAELDADRVAAAIEKAAKKVAGKPE